MSDPRSIPLDSRAASGFRSRLRRVARWWRAPFWALALLTGAKSFADNPILGSRRLNRLGLHLLRLRLAHWLAWSRRARLARSIPSDLRDEFDRNGFIVIRDFLSADRFADLRSRLFATDMDFREQQQGDTYTRRSPVGPKLRKRIPELAALLDSRLWNGLCAYVASTRSRPIYHVQQIAGGAAEGPPDPQIQLHSDTFHPSLKAWLFLTDVAEDGRPLTYVAGSHCLTKERLAWERRKSETVLELGDRLSQRGSLRIEPEELAGLGLPQPTHFAVPANTLVLVDTCGFHARADSDRPTERIELWAYCRRSPFLPWTGGDILSVAPLAYRRAEWAAAILDWLDRRGWRKQHWRPIGQRRIGPV